MYWKLQGKDKIRFMRYAGYTPAVQTKDGKRVPGRAVTEFIGKPIPIPENFDSLSDEVKGYFTSEGEKIAFKQFLRAIHSESEDPGIAHKKYVIAERIKKYGPNDQVAETLKKETESEMVDPQEKILKEMAYDFASAMSSVSPKLREELVSILTKTKNNK